MIFSHESVYDVWQEVLPLAHAQWLELQARREHEQFNPDVERYARFQDMGIYFHICARVEGKLVGSAGLYILPSMHTQRLIATEDTFYLRPDYRARGRNIFRFVQFTETFAASKGAEKFMLTTPLANPSAERVVAHLGYTQFSKGWVKDLEHALKQEAA